MVTINYQQEIARGLICCRFISRPYWVRSRLCMESYIAALYRVPWLMLQCCVRRRRRLSSVSNVIYCG